MGAGRFWAARERRQPRFSLQQARERIRLPKDLRRSEPTKPQPSLAFRSSDRDRVAEAREWIETQCATAGFGDLDLGKPPSHPLSSKTSSISLTPSIMTQNTTVTIQDPDAPTSAEDLQMRIDVLTERIADRERKIRTRQQLERLQAEEEGYALRGPSVEVIPEKTEQDPLKSTQIELDSHSAINLSILEETEAQDELPAYSNPNGVSIAEYKNYRPPTPPHPAFSSYQLIEPGQMDILDRSRSASLTPKPYLHGPEGPLKSPDMRVDEALRTVPEGAKSLKPPNRPIHQRTLSAPGDRAAQPAADFQQGGRGRSVSIDTRNLSPTGYSPISSAVTTWDSSTAATTPSEDVKNTSLSVSSARSPPPPPITVPTTPIVYCDDPIALSPTEHPSEDLSLFSDLESLAGAYRIRPRSSMSNLQRNLSHASQAPIPVSSITSKGQGTSYLAGQASRPVIPAWPN
ncbi:MAG: hypothetical protein Q9195_008966 [Heterodermia aff. obscurata]